MKVDDEIELRGAQSPREIEVVPQPRQAARAFDDDDLVDARVMTHHRLGRSFHEVRNARVWEFPPERADGRRREHDVANQPQTDEKDVVYGSIVASSISITGMSSLMGYTR